MVTDADFPILDSGLAEYRPNEEPFKVTVTDESAELLIERLSRTEPALNDTASVIVPSRLLDVTAACSVPDTPRPTLHLTDVSDAHSVASHPVCPSRLRPV